MTRSADLIAAIAKNIQYAQNDVKAKKSPSAHLAKAAGYAEELADLGLVDIGQDSADSPSGDYAVSDTSGFFKAVVSGDDAVYAPGGSPNNPNGVSWTLANARRWWEAVFAAGLNISKVRSTLTPGSSVLTAEGYAAAAKLGEESETYAPEGYNPLDLPVVP